MATNNAINNISNPFSSTAVTVDPATSADAPIQFSITATPEFIIGIDNSASNAFKISQGSALGTNDTFIMTTAGQNTMPLQPAFLAYLASTDSNVTGDGTGYTLGTNVAFTEVFDQGSNFNTNGTFTAPITGRYFFFSAILTGDLGAANTSCRVLQPTSNRTYGWGQLNVGAARDVNNQYTFIGGTMADMDAADTCTLQINVSNGTKIVDIIGSAAADTYFCGYLAC